MDPIRNFAKVEVSTGYDDTDVTIVLESGYGALLPDPSSEGAFNLVWWDWTTYKDPSDDPKKEIVRCTARTTDTLTVTRSQEGTSASTKNTSGSTYKMSLDFTKKQHDNLVSEISAKANTASPTFTGTVSMPVIKITTGAALNKILYSAADGTASWGTAPVSFAWGVSITGNSGNGLSIALSANSAVSSYCINLDVTSSQSNTLGAMKIATGTSANVTGLYIVGSNPYTGLINLALGTAANSCGLQITAPQGAGNQTPVAIESRNTSITIQDWRSKSGLNISQTGVNGNAQLIYGGNNVNCSSYGLFNITLSNTQSGASVLQKIDMGTSAQGHIGTQYKIANASTSVRAITIDPESTSTGIGIEFKNVVSTLTKMGGDGFKGIYFPMLANGVDTTTVMGTRYGIYFDSLRGGNSDSGTGVQYGIYFNNVRNGAILGEAYPIFIEALGNSSGRPAGCLHIKKLGSQNCYGVRIEDLGAVGDYTTPDTCGFYIGAMAASYSRGTSGRFYHFRSVQQDEFYSRVAPMAETIVQRINTRNGYNYADNFNVHEIRHKSGQFTDGGTFADAGAVLYCEALVQTTAGSFTHTRDVYNATQSATVTTGKLFTGVVGATERFKVHPMVTDGASAVAYLFDTTTALANAGAKIASFAVAGVEKAYIDKDGNFVTV